MKRFIGVSCCVSIQGLHPSEEHFERRTKALQIQMLLLFPVFGGCTATILRGLTYPKILCTPEKEERKSEDGDVVWCRLSLSQAWAAEIMT